MNALKIAQSSPLLTALSLLALPDAAHAVELPLEQLLMELQNMKAELVVQALDRNGVEIQIDRVNAAFNLTLNLSIKHQKLQHGNPCSICWRNSADCIGYYAGIRA